MSLMRIAVLAACLILLALPASAQSVSSRGMATTNYGFRLDAEKRREAMNNAALNALEAYVAETGAAKVKLFDQRRGEFASNINRYVLSSTVLSEEEDKKAKTYTVVVRSQINATLVQAALDGGSATANTRGAERSLLTFVFVARSQDSVQSFDDKVYRRADVTSSYDEKTREGESFRGNSVSTSGNRTETSSQAVTTGGSVARKSDNVAWKVANAGEVNSAMSGIFSAAGYEVVEAEYVEGESRGLLSLASIRQDFGTGNDLSSQTMRNTADGVRAAGIPYLAYGTLDVGMRDRDPASGNVRIHVTVTGKVLDLSGRFPRTVSSVGPVQYAGLGPDESVARTNALREAAEQAAQLMTNELNLKQVR